MSRARRQVVLLIVMGVVLCAAWAIGASEVGLASRGDSLTAPDMDHLFGTDLAGRDVLTQILRATGIAAVTVGGVACTVHVGGFAVGFLLAYLRGRVFRDLLVTLIHYWLTLPVLLIAVFVMILLGSGQLKLAIILALILIPSQALYVHSQLSDARKLDFVLVKRSLGFSRLRVVRRDVFPYVEPSVRDYTLSRLPEILVMDLAYNFLGLGVQPPDASLGRMLFDGLPFMFSAWWIWVGPAACLCIAVAVATVFTGRTRQNGI